MGHLTGIMQSAIAIMNGVYSKNGTAEQPDNRSATLQSKTSSSGTLSEGGGSTNDYFSKKANSLGSTGYSGLGFKI